MRPGPAPREGRASTYARLVSDVRPIHLSSGLPETVLPAEPAPIQAALADALAQEGPARKAAVAAVAARVPTYLDAWARLAELADGPVESYAYARVGYHRGLDALRRAGWRGSGYCRWVHEENRGFLRALDALRAAAEAIGETDERDRCAEFLIQLDPEWRRRA
jgi:hypothetical protein